MKDKKKYDSLPVRNKDIEKIMPGGYVMQQTPSMDRAAAVRKSIKKVQPLLKKKPMPTIKERFIALKKGL